METGVSLGKCYREGCAKPRVLEHQQDTMLGLTPPAVALTGDTLSGWKLGSIRPHQ